VRVRALSGVAGPVAFTAAWVAASLRQTGHGAVSVQLSGLAAPDARDPWIMISGFLVLGGCTVWFGEELARDVGGPAPRLIQGAGVLTMAAGLLRRDHMQLTSGPVSWHNEAHNVVSLVLYLDLVLAQLLLARRFGAIPAGAPGAFTYWAAESRRPSPSPSSSRTPRRRAPAFCSGSRSPSRWPR
jgi:hypothetical protein